MNDNKEIGIVIGVTMTAMICFIAAVGGYFIITSIDAGETGVKFNLLSGGTQEDEYGEGLHFKAPWVKVSKFNIKTQEYTMSKIVEEGILKRDDRIRTVTSEGLYLDLDITVLYRIDADDADDILQTIGKEGQYQEIIIRPTVRNSVREIISQYEAMDIYGDNRSTIEFMIFESMKNQLDNRSIIVEALLIRDIEIPADLSDAISAKKTAEQEVMQMVYVLDKERVEKDRKIVEAEGISEANEIIAANLTTEYLTWYWINNLNAHNSVIYVPVGDSGLPLFREVAGEQEARREGE